MAWSGKASGRGRRRQGGGYQTGSGAMVRARRSRRWSGGWRSALAEGGGLEAAEGLGVELEEEGLRAVDEADGDGPVLVGGVPRLEEGGLLRDVRLPEAAVRRCSGRAGPGWGRRGRWRRRLAAPAGERPDAGAALVADDVVGVVGVGRRCRRARPCRGGRRRAPRSSSTDWNGADVAVGATTGQRMASCGGVGLGDRPVEEARGSRGARGRWCRAGSGRRRRSSRRNRRRRR